MTVKDVRKLNGDDATIQLIVNDNSKRKIQKFYKIFFIEQASYLVSHII